MINLENTYRITIDQFVQYIESDCMDNAIKAARNSFHANLYKLKGAVESQKACPLTKLSGRLVFGFNGGWNTLDVSGLTIFEALEQAKNHPFAKSLDITEIHSTTGGR